MLEVGKKTIGFFFTSLLIFLLCADVDKSAILGLKAGVNDYFCSSTQFTQIKWELSHKNTLITMLPISVEWHCKKSPLGFIFIKQTSFKEANGGIYSNASFVPTK